MRGLVLAAALSAQTPEQLFQERILPVLKSDCQGCHGDGQVLSKLDLRTRDGLLRGGARGAAVVPGKPADSWLVRALRGESQLQMPPGKRLSAGTIAAVEQWISAGAPWAEASAARWTYKDEDLWAFRPVKRYPDATIDKFVSARLAAKDLSPSPRADRRTLIRRVTFDLTGLPPSPEEVEAFVSDRSADAWRKLVDRLLSSPRYGERWGRHWLDVVRYADTNGYSNDFERPNAWRYRDYVIRAFNSDKPYDQFIREQIAGDELYPENTEALIATGFLRAGPWEHTGMSVEAVTRQMFLDDVTHGTAATFLGLTLGCARCHDHKFDPIPTRDYYRMQAVFASTEFARPKAPFLATENTSGLGPGREHLKQIVDRTSAHMKGYDDIAVANAMRKHGVTRREDLPKGVAEKAIRDKEGIGSAQFEELKLYQKHMQLYRESLDRYEPKAFAVSSGPRDGETDGGGNIKYPSRAAYKPSDIHVLPGGNIQAPGEKVEPGVLSMMERFGYPAPAVPASTSGRRAALAQWIANPANPLTARVMANRIWQYHFGRGLAADANNFGKMGRKPTHPELLDFLAGLFVEKGWSVKAVHRVILMSNVYQQSSAPPTDAAAKDPDNELLSYYSPRRVEAEVLRDSILAVSGELSPSAGGPGTYPQINEDAARQPQHRMGSLAPAYHASAKRQDRNRRTVYTFQQRSLMDPLVEVFNGANMDFSCERREASTVPTQAFALLNSQFAHDMALAFALRVEREAAPAKRVDRAFQIAFGRAPTAQERTAAAAHLKKMTAHHASVKPAPRPKREPVIHTITGELTGEQHRLVQEEDPAPYEENSHPSECGAPVRALAELTLALLNSNEFVYVY